MKNKLICKLLALGLITSSLSSFQAKETYASDFSNIKSNAILTSTFSQIDTISLDEVSSQESLEITPRTSYDWWVYNLGVSSLGISQIIGPHTGNSFNTEALIGSNRIFTISWTGAPSNAKFKIKAVGSDSGNSGSTNFSSYCTGTSGSIKLTIPYADRGVVKLYVDNYASVTMNLKTIQVAS